MRSSIVGSAFALVLIGALFAAVHFGGRQAKQSAGEKSRDPSQVAVQIKEGFTGDRLIGDWKLSCEPSQELPKAPGVGGRISRSSKRTPVKKAPPPAWKIPRCRVYLELTVPRDPDGKIRVTFRQAGFKRILSLFLRFPSNDVIVGDKVTLRLNKTEWVMPVHDCHPDFCLVIESITKADVGPLLTAKTLMLAFAARPSGKQIVIPVPVNGLGPAIGAVHRIDR